MRTEPLGLEHQELLSPRYSGMNVDLGEYNFAQLYLFRNVHRYEVVFSKDIYIKGLTRDGFKCLMPATPIEAIDMSDMLECLNGLDFLFPIPEAWASHFSSQNFDIVSLERDSDYMFTVDKLSNYPGRHLSGRRNLVKQFNEHYPDHKSVEVTLNNLGDCQKMLDEWCKHAPLHAQATDCTETREALKLFEKLRLKGHITYAEEKPVGFILGMPLNPQTFMFAFAKGLIEFKGVYQYLYQEFAKSLPKNFQMINLEEDLGDEELRHAKRAYHPDKLAKKLRVSPCKAKV